MPRLPFRTAAPTAPLRASLALALGLAACDAGASGALSRANTDATSLDALPGTGDARGTPPADRDADLYLDRGPPALADARSPGDAGSTDATRSRDARPGMLDAASAADDAAQPPGPAADALAPPPADAAPDPACPAGRAAQEVAIGAAFTGDSGCAPLSYFAVAAAGVELHLSARGAPPGGAIAVTDGTGAALGDAVADERGVFSLQVTTRLAGELRFTLGPGPQPADTELRGSLVCVSHCDLEATRYPIVLMHGMAGTDRYFGLLDYFYDIVPLLTGRGYSVATPVVPAIGPSLDRARALAPQIDAVLAATGAAKVHLIAHSQGGLDARILVSGLGYADRVASVTTVSTPHGGIPIDLPDWLTGEDFSHEGMARFARAYPDVEAMPRFSWAGRTCALLEADCRAANDDEIVELVLGPSHALMAAAGADDGDRGENDGVVMLSAARWGTFLGVLPADHFDEVGQIADAAPAPFDHRAFYLSEARRLRDLEVSLGL